MKKNYLGIVIIAVLVIMGVIAYYLLFPETSDNRNSDTALTKQAKEQISGRQVFYYVNEYVDADNFDTTIFSYDLDSQSTNELFTFSSMNMRFSEMLVTNDGFLVTPDTSNNTTVQHFIFSGTLIGEVEIRGDYLGTFIADTKGQMIAVQEYESVDTDDLLDKSMSLRVYDVNSGEMVVSFAASDFEYDGQTLSYIEPIAFDSTGNLIIIVGPSQGGDVGDHLIVYKVGIEQNTKEQILFTGAPGIYEEDISQEAFAESSKQALIFFDAIPAYNLLLLARGLDQPRDIILYNYESTAMETVYGRDNKTMEAALYPRERNDIGQLLSPGGNKLILARGPYDSQSKSVQLNQHGFHLIDLNTDAFVQDFKKSGDFIAWINDDVLLYKNTRKSVWDDQYHSLELIDLASVTQQAIYTQTTSYPESPSSMQTGDKFYTFISYQQL